MCCSVELYSVSNFEFSIIWTGFSLTDVVVYSSSPFMIYLLCSSALWCRYSKSFLSLRFFFFKGFFFTISHKDCQHNYHVLPVGEGILIHRSGDRFEGRYVNDLKDGPGLRVFKGTSFILKVTSFFFNFVW